MTIWLPDTVGQELSNKPPGAEDFSAADVAAAQQFGQTLGIADWLGPLAPVALPPFFGITCLSGMALYGRGFVSADNAFLGEQSPLSNPAVFWTFLILTLITSIPRFTKVSKPFAQAIDQIEAWAGIITLITLKVLMASHASTAEEMPVVELGLVSLTLDTLLMIAAAINIFVINAVKFFFEMLIWMTPVPAIDAVFEVVNKTACAVLMAIYGFSPTIATTINLILLGFSLLVFRWIYRREVFFRTMLLDAVWSIVRPRRSISNCSLQVFPVQEFGPFPARTRCRLERTETGWTLTQQRLLRSDVMLTVDATDCAATIECGYLTNCLKVSGRHGIDLTFSRRYNACLPELANALNASCSIPESNATFRREALRTELC